MLVVAVAALSNDGFIARSSDELVNWSSPEDKQFFVEETKRLGTLIMGRTTFETIGRALPGRRMIVLSSTPEKYQVADVEFTNDSPQELLQKLEKMGVQSVAIVGGAQVYGQFLGEGLVDELALTVEFEVALGSGIQLTPEPFTTKLNLTECRYLSEKTHLFRFNTM